MTSFEAIYFMRGPTPNPLDWMPIQSAADATCGDKRVTLILSHALSLRDAHVRRMLQEMEERGFQSEAVALDDLGLLAKLPEHLINRSALYNGDLLLVDRFALGGADQQDVLLRSGAHPQLLRDELSGWLQQGSSAPALNEPMLLSAPIARQLASVLCSGGSMDALDCSWYHGTWQYLRLLDVVSTPSWHSDFYLNAFRGAAERDASPTPAVLVSGTADYSMPAYVIDGIPGAEVLVCDLCEMPLLLSKWYGLASGHPIATSRGDIRRLEAGPFDVVTADAFLTRFSAVDRAEILTAWARLLKPHGRIVTTVRIDSASAGTGVVTPDPDEVASFVARVARRAEPWLGFLDVSIDELRRRASEYAERMISNSLPDVDTLLKEITELQLTVDDISIVQVPGELHSSHYARLILSKDAS